MGGLCKRFHHQHDVLRRIKSVKSGGGFVQLVPQDQNEVTARYFFHTAIMLND